MQPKAVIVHSLAQAEAALAAAAALDRPVLLLTAPGAAAVAGPLWFSELVAEARRRVPRARARAVLDCGDAPGHVMAALRSDSEAIVFTGPPETAGKLADMAAQVGVELLTAAPPALDLLDQPDPAAACRAWLAR